MKTKTIIGIGHLLLIGFCLLSVKHANAATSDPSPIHPSPIRDTTPIIDWAYFKGVDTLVFSINLGPGAGRALSTVADAKTKQSMIQNLQKVFADANSHLCADDSWISINPGPFNAELMKPNVLALNFLLSARSENINGKPVAVAALDLVLGKEFPHQPFEVRTQPASYPFVVPDNKGEFEKRLGDGVVFLTSFLPSYIVGANRYGRPSQQCPDCNVNCKPDAPYGGQ